MAKFCYIIRATQNEGVWVKDSQTNELALVFVEVLAMLGDNPMQSEFACHVGLGGKYFCRCCWVKGHDAMAAESPEKSHVDGSGPVNSAQAASPVTTSAGQSPQVSPPTSPSANSHQPLKDASTSTPPPVHVLNKSKVSLIFVPLINFLALI
jgi:hypothetical protein